MEVFSTRGYEEVSVEEIAERAGISRGLLYHYFPTKRDFFVAVAEAAAAEVAELTEPDPNLSPDAMLYRAISQFLAYAESHPQGFLTTYRGSVAGDPAVRRVVETAGRRQEERILTLVSHQGESSAALRLAIKGWLAFAREVTAAWLQQRRPGRQQVGDLLLRVLRCAVAPPLASDPVDNERPHSARGPYRG